MTRSIRQARQHKRDEHLALLSGEQPGSKDYRHYTRGDFPRFKPSPGYVLEGNRTQAQRVKTARWVADD